MRIYIGQISDALAEDPAALTGRLEKYGVVEEPLTIKKKAFSDTHFAFAQMAIDADKFLLLQKSLNSSVFRQSKLNIQEATADFAEREMERNKSDKQGSQVVLNEDQIKRMKTPDRRFNVISGRERENPRPSHHKTTIRFEKLDKNGKKRVVKLKMKKQKLWGYEKRDPDSLVFTFDSEAGEWKDFNGKSVEVLGADETQRNEKLAAQIDTNNFLSDSDFDNFKAVAVKLADAEWEDDELEIVASEAGPRFEFTKYNADSGSDTEPEIYDNTPAQGTAQTEALRDVLSVNAPFTLFGDSNAADVPMDGDGNAMAVDEPEVAVLSVPLRRKFGLFFAHSKSPFLHSQTQAAKITGTFDEKKWDTEFWEKRGEYNRLLRHRRKEASKLQRKRT